MYVHTHWGYNRPYSARRWTVADWEGYLEGLARLGFDTVKVWPQIDTMPVIPTASDAAYLRTLAQATDIAHRRFGMKVIVVLAANCMGNEKAADYEFATRPYFVCEKKVNPQDKAEMAAFLEQRRNTLMLVKAADAIAVIDSDPGGFIGSTNADFAMLCAEQTRVFREANPRGEFVYWMLAGWETYCAFWRAQRDNPQADANLWCYQKPDEFDVILTLLKTRIPEPWWLTSWLPQHEAAINRQGLRDKAMFYPYGAVEGEPVFPLIVCYGLGQALNPKDIGLHPRGAMANAQSHCLQLPHTYWFARLVKGDKTPVHPFADTESLTAFAARLIPAQAAAVAEGWNAIESREPARQRAAARALRGALGKPLRTGDLAGLLFGDAERFLLDLAMNLELRAALVELGAAVERGGDVRASVRLVLERFVPWQERVGFVDAYGGPLYGGLNEPLKKLDDPALDAVLKDFEDWHNPSIRNGIVPRLIAAMRRYLA
ncbi:MAG: hypothetical protein HY360_19645 [Verrucomicrobia bacterium]|nr:hypothetical protein [Verrucomicrobiota bacterium]